MTDEASWLLRRERCLAVLASWGLAERPTVAQARVSLDAHAPVCDPSEAAVRQRVNRYRLRALDAHQAQRGG